jgi:hypothetical protein
MKRLLFTGTIAMLLLGGLTPAWGLKELTDGQMESLTAGANVTTQMTDGVLNFQFQKENGRRHIDGEGSIAMTQETLPGPSSTLIVRDNAQGNLRALVNLNAINSDIDVLINLNVNINSTVGTVRQINLTRN